MSVVTFGPDKKYVCCIDNSASSAIEVNFFNSVFQSNAPLLFKNIIYF